MRWRLGVCAALCVGCSSGPAVPGNDVMGTFLVTATLADGGTLPLVDPSGQPIGVLSILDSGTPISATACDAGANQFCFTGILSRKTPLAPGQSVYPAWLTVNNYPRPGGFDGQFFASVATAPRAFDACNCGEGVTVTETLVMAVLSATQASAAGGQCPPNSLDGGIPSGPGITMPVTGPGGFDGRLVCGTVLDDFQPMPDAGCTCLAGSAEFRLSGVRQ